MITYPDGRQVCVGDKVLMTAGREPGVVHAVIDSPRRIEAWGLSEAGLMIDVPPQGLNFWPLHSLSYEDELRFVSRGVAELGASPSGESAKPLGDPRFTKGPPSVS